MGQSFPNFMTRFFDKKEIGLLMLGLDAAGKTTLLYRLKLGSVLSQTIPTIGFNVETIEHKNISFVIWDVGGGDKIKPLWRHYYLDNTKGIIFIVDSIDRERIEEAGYHLHYLLNFEKLDNAVLLVFANKQDLPNPMTPAEIADKLKLYGLRNRRWFVQVGSAIQGQGLSEGLNWLYNMLTIS